MWKWLTVGILIYGLLAGFCITAPRGQALTRLADLADLGEAWGLQPEIPPVHDFETATPPPLTRPQSMSEVIALSDGNHVLRWQPAVDAPLSVLGLPVRPDGAGGTALHVEVQCSRPGLIVLGVREQDGSIYGDLCRVHGDRQRIVLPLDMLRLVLNSSDENGVLDLDQVDGVFIIAASPEGLREHLPELGSELERRRGAELSPPSLDTQPPVFELDLFGLINADLPPEGPPPEGPPPGAGQEFAQDDGMRQPGAHGGRLIRLR